MKATIKITQEVKVKTLMVDIEPRHIGDSEDDDMPTDFPLLNEDKTRWIAKIDIDTGRIADWPQGEVREMYIKVCDAGNYTLLDSAGNKLDELTQEYVPNKLVPGEYGDYIDLKIDSDGFITNWYEQPELSDFPKFDNEDD